MSFIDQIPKHLQTLEIKKKQTENEINALYFKLEEDEEADEIENHFCTCEFCPYQDKVIKRLNKKEIDEINQKIEELQPVAKEIDQTIKRLEAYRDMWSKK